MEKHINSLISQYRKDGEINTNEISDGYHTFGELYEHRVQLFISLCNTVAWEDPSRVWKTKKNSEGVEWPGWFILGVNTVDKKQITYHIPIDRWDDCDVGIIKERNSDFDGHTSKDVLERLKNL